MRRIAVGLVVALVFAGAQATAKPLKVYILAGQSNMQGQARTTTLPGMASDPVSKPLYDKIADENGKPRVYEDVSVAAFSRHKGKESERHGPLTVGFGSDLTRPDVFGPELAFGITMVEHVKEPILIIKTSWGGKSLNTDFRPPSAGPYQFSDNAIARLKKKGAYEKVLADKKEATGRYYRLMLKHVQTVLADPGKYCPAYDPKQGHEIAGFVWFQGWNDMVDSGTYPGHPDAPDRFKLYSELLAHFIRDVRKDLKAPDMPFVIGVIGTGGKPGRADPFREGVLPASVHESF